MSRKGAGKRFKSAKLSRSHANKLNVVDLTLDDIPPVPIVSPAKFEAYMRQQEYYNGLAAGIREILTDGVTIPQCLTDNGVGVECDTNTEDPQRETNILINQSKANRNLRHHMSAEADSNQLQVPYRPISSHQYLTSTELKNSSLHDTNIHLGRPTRTTLLRDRQRNRSLTAVNNGRDASQKPSQKQELRTMTRYEAVTNILYSMIPPGQSLHSFLSGARYNRSHWIESIGNLDSASYPPVTSGLPFNMPRSHPAHLVLHDIENVPRAPPDSPADFLEDSYEEVSTPVLFPSLNVDPSGAHVKQTGESRSLKVAWEDSKRQSSMTKQDTNAPEKVRLQSEERDIPVIGNLYGANHDRAHHINRPLSVRGPVAHPTKSNRDIEVHGISLLSNTMPSARDGGYHQTPAEPPNSMRRSWSAMSYNALGSRVPMEFNQLDPLKVTGVKFTGPMDSGRSGTKTSVLKSSSVRLESNGGVAETEHRPPGERNADDELDKMITKRESVSSGASDGKEESDDQSSVSKENVYANLEDQLEEQDQHDQTELVTEPTEYVDEQVVSQSHPVDDDSSEDHGQPNNSEEQGHVSPTEEFDQQDKPDEQVVKNGSLVVFLTEETQNRTGKDDATDHREKVNESEKGTDDDDQNNQKSLLHGVTQIGNGSSDAKVQNETETGLSDGYENLDIHEKRSTSSSEDAAGETERTLED